MKKIKVVDLSTLLPGPLATRMLIKLVGAEVTKVEDETWGDMMTLMRPTEGGISLVYKYLNEGKKIEKVNWREGGITKVKKIITGADIVVENFKPGRADKMGLGFDELKKEAKNIIYCSVRGYPIGHPLEKKSAHDANILATGGYLHSQADLPPLLMADVLTGFLTTAKILAEVVKNERPCKIEVAMWEALREGMDVFDFPQLKLGRELTSSERIFEGGLPCYSSYEIKDGKAVVAALEKPLWVDFCMFLDKPQWVSRQFEPSLKEEVALEMKKTEKATWEKPELDFCVSPILSILEARKRGYV